METVVLGFGVDDTDAMPRSRPTRQKQQHIARRVSFEANG